MRNVAVVVVSYMLFIDIAYYVFVSNFIVSIYVKHESNINVFYNSESQIYFLCYLL